MATMRHTIRQYPLRSGLLTAGQQATIAEDGLWRAQNVTSRFDGLLERRPGLSKWGQTLQTPGVAESPSVISAWQSFATESDWTVDETSAGSAFVDGRSDNILSVAILQSAGAETLTYSRDLAGTETTPASDDWSLRFSAKSSNAPAYTPSDTDPPGLRIIAQAAAGSGKRFALMQQGLYYQKATDDTYELITTNSELDDERWHVISILMDKDGNTTVTVDDSATYTITSTLVKSVTPTGALLDLDWLVDSSQPYYTFVADVMYRDTATSPFTARRIDALLSFPRRTPSGQAEDLILAVAGGALWVDRGATGHWVSNVRLPFGSAYLGRYKTQATIVSSDANLRQGQLYVWDGDQNEPEAQENSPKIAFAVEHKSRLWAAGDRGKPLRLYFSGNRQPDVWFTPETDAETVDNVLEAGYINIPGEGNDSITAIYGDFLGTLIVFTKDSIWQLTGDGFDTFAVTQIPGDAGCNGINGVEQVGNDLLFDSQWGVRSLKASAQYGDMETGMPSLAIRDIWTDNSNLGFRIRPPATLESKLKYSRRDSQVYVCLHNSNEPESERLMVYNPLTQQWLGPWTMQTTVLATFRRSNRQEEFMMHGRTDGIVAITNRNNRSDMGADYTVIIETPFLSGRSLDPGVTPYEKLWADLRVFLSPRGEWPFTIETQVDADVTKDDYQSISQNFYRYSTLDDNFVLDDDKLGVLESAHQVGPIRKKLDQKGRYLRIVFTQSGAGENFVFQGYEVDFTRGRLEADG